MENNDLEARLKAVEDKLEGRRLDEVDSISVGSSSKVQVKVYYDSTAEAWDDDLKAKLDTLIDVAGEAKQKYEDAVGVNIK